MKLKRNMVIIVVIAIMMTACTPQRNKRASSIVEKSESVNVQEIREFLMKADNLVFEELRNETITDEKSEELLNNRTFGGNTEVIALEYKSIIYAFKDSAKANERIKSILSELGKYYENEWEATAQLRRGGIVYIDGKAGYPPFEYGMHGYIYDESEIKVLDVEKDETGMEIITCSVEKISRMTDVDRGFRNFYTYKLRRFKDGEYLVMYDGSLNNSRRITPAMASEFVKVEGETNVEGHSPKSLTDCEITTKWIGKDENRGLGETLTFNFKKPTYLESMLIVDGDNEGSIKTDRITKVKIELSSGEEIIKNFNHHDVVKMDYLIDLSNFEKTEYVKLTILDIKESDDKNPVGISDVYFFGRGVSYE